MGSRRDNIDEFSPWPSYVDIFASTIMVLLLFMLILFSLVAHYAQVASELEKLKVVRKESESDPLERLTKTNKLQIAIDTQQEKSGLIQAEGGALSYDEQKQQVKQDFKSESMEIIFNNMDIFLDKALLDQVKEAARRTLKKGGDAKILLLVGDPKSAISSTLAKQISLGRVINLKNKLEKSPEFEGKVSIATDQRQEAQYPYGHIRITTK